ncbi:hypothetical protein BTHI11S_00190 [Bosea thiooxidans]
MDAFAALLTGFQVALTPLNLAVAFAGVALGTAIGALPGIGPINAVALLLPLCFARTAFLVRLARLRRRAARRGDA